MFCKIVDEIFVPDIGYCSFKCTLVKFRRSSNLDILDVKLELRMLPIK